MSPLNVLPVTDATGVTIERITCETRVNPLSTITFIVATTRTRSSLQTTLNSIQLWPGDEILVTQCDPPGGDWGHTERNMAIPHAKGGWLAFIDDDDWYVPGARAVQADAIASAINHRRFVPIVFRMRFPNGKVLWRENDPDCRNGNIGTPMMLVPNMATHLHRFGHRFEGDFDFINNSKWPRRTFVFRKEILVELGHDGRSEE